MRERKIRGSIKVRCSGETGDVPSPRKERAGGEKMWEERERT
jgi:hypothetical protein